MAIKGALDALCVLKARQGLHRMHACMHPGSSGRIGGGKGRPDSLDASPSVLGR